MSYKTITDGMIDELNEVKKTADRLKICLDWIKEGTISKATMIVRDTRYQFTKATPTQFMVVATYNEVAYHHWTFVKFEIVIDSTDSVRLCFYDVNDPVHQHYITPTDKVEFEINN